MSLRWAGTPATLMHGEFGDEADDIPTEVLRLT